MRNEVSVYKQIHDPVTAMVSIGQAIAKSQLFGCQSEEQGQVLAMECMARQMPPLSLATEYDIIQGKLSMKADAMLAGFEQAGGSYKIVSYTPELCAIEFRRGESVLPISISWEDAQKESWPYGKDGKTFKQNWASPIARQDMLWARVVSRGVRRLAPGVVCGRYTPEEINDFDSSPAAQATSAVSTVRTSPGKTIEAQVVNSNVVSSQVVDSATNDSPAGSTAAVIDTSSAQPSQNGHAEPINCPIKEETIEEIKNQVVQAKQQPGLEEIDTRIVEKLNASGFEKLNQLTEPEGKILLDAIHKKSIEAFIDASLVGHEKAAVKN